MLELLEELAPPLKKMFRQKVHQHELTSFSLNGRKGQALVLTNHYLYLLYKGMLRSKCYKIAPQQLANIEVKDNLLVIKTQKKETHTISFPPEKIYLLPKVTKLLQSWLKKSSFYL